VLELVLLFGLGPVLLAMGPRWLVSVGILASGLLCLAALLSDPTFLRRQLGGLAEARAGLARVLVRTSVIWPALRATTLLLRPQALFLFPRTRTRFWILVMILYPMSAYAQELMFRTFFFHRYRAIFARPTACVLGSALIFGWAHVVVNNFFAVALSAVAGWLFASTYDRSRSTLLVAFEHALYGDFVFTVGLGEVFYSAARWVAHG
jgi:hypothetical protein